MIIDSQEHEALEQLLGIVEMARANPSIDYTDLLDETQAKAHAALAARENTEQASGRLVVDCAAEKHSINHRIERSTSGMSARCLDCDWSYEYD